eukprot:CAMPEP_0118949546 /NCGR_PEP_ID=MMETSP1169-20130426/49834_1 /TAXON_ID=36882 /ORGANISM="Pyramimonas obovata, Strain CCMP722" /LENGTH=123 /DNA_ID=CAMNT_0006896211 /DNA_START=158 /DNA_END=526 /DNA_ORIENTATION=-
MPKELNPHIRPQAPPAAIEVGSYGGLQLKKAISVKLVDFLGEYTDDVLAEYILVMMAHGKTRDQTQDDLEAFLGKDSIKFTEWLWENLAENKRTYEQMEEGGAGKQPEGEAAQPTAEGSASVV